MQLLWNWPPFTAYCTTGARRRLGSEYSLLWMSVHSLEIPGHSTDGHSMGTLSDGTCLVRFSPPGSPPTKTRLRRKSTPGNPRRHPQQSSLGRHRRPPRSFSSRAMLFRLLKCNPWGKCAERGRALRDPEGRGWGSPSVAGQPGGQKWRSGVTDTFSEIGAIAKNT